MALGTPPLAWFYTAAWPDSSPPSTPAIILLIGCHGTDAGGAADDRATFFGPKFSIGFW